MLGIGLITLSTAQWQIEKFGPLPTIKSYDVEIGDGRNDGTNRLYIYTNEGGGIY